MGRSRCPRGPWYRTKPAITALIGAAAAAAVVSCVLLVLRSPATGTEESTTLDRARRLREKLLADPDRVRRVEIICDGMRKAHSAPIKMLTGARTQIPNGHAIPATANLCGATRRKQADVERRAAHKLRADEGRHRLRDHAHGRGGRRRGNYPVASFDGMDTWPSSSLRTPLESALGLDAAAVRQEPGWSVLRSFKRLINDAGPRTEVDLGGRSSRWPTSSRASLPG